ncbi:hypothetical protein ABPG74_022579 [Tetrahymena malaccensis]
MNSQDDVALNNLGLIYKDMLMIDEAKECFLKAIQINPKNSAFYTNLGQLCHYQQKPNDAEIYFLNALKINPQCFLTLNSLGILHKQNSDNAEKYFQNALQINPQCYQASNNLGLLMIKKKNYSQAKIYLQMAQISNPQVYIVYQNLAFLCLEKQYKSYKDTNFLEAEDYFLKSLQINPQLKLANHNLGLFYYDHQNHYMNKTKEIRQCLLNSQLLIGPFQYLLSNILESYLHSIQDEEERKQLLEKYNLYNDNYQKLSSKDRLKLLQKNLLEAIKINPNDENIYFCLGKLYQYSNNNEALYSFFKAININPQYYNAHYELGNLYKHMDMLEQAKLCYQKAFQINPKSDIALYRLGQIYQQINMFQEAQQCYLKAWQINGNNSYYYINLSNLFEKMNMPLESKQYKILFDQIQYQSEYADKFLFMQSIFQ